PGCPSGLPQPVHGQLDGGHKSDHIELAQHHHYGIVKGKAMGLWAFRPNVVTDQKIGEEVFDDHHHKNGAYQYRDKGYELSLEYVLWYQKIDCEVSERDVYGKTQQIRFEGIQIIVEITAPSQKIEGKVY